MKPEKSFYKSKKFWAAMIGVLFAIARPIAAAHGYDIPIETFAPILAYLVGQGIADHGKNKRNK